MATVNNPITNLSLSHFDVFVFERFLLYLHACTQCNQQSSFPKIFITLSHISQEWQIYQHFIYASSLSTLKPSSCEHPIIHSNLAGIDRVCQHWSVSTFLQPFNSATHTHVDVPIRKQSCPGRGMMELERKICSCSVILPICLSMLEKADGIPIFPFKCHYHTSPGLILIMPCTSGLFTHHVPLPGADFL